MLFLAKYRILFEVFILVVRPMEFGWIGFFFTTVSSIKIGRINHIIYQTNDTPLLSFTASSCQSCFCRALSFNNALFMILNCFENGRACMISPRNSSMTGLQ